jgi:PadR family transcriptional regulator, regulatory protein PadR
MTMQTMLVLGTMLADPAKRRFGLELCEETGQPSGTIYPILARLESFGWIEGHKESSAEHLAEGRRARYYYTLTDEGAVRARAALEQAMRSRGRAAGLRRAMP